MHSRFLRLGIWLGLSGGLLWTACGDPQGDPACPGGVVLDGTCWPLDCELRDCPAGFVCQAELCVEIACLGVACRADEGCAKGACHPRDCAWRTCPGLGEICIEEECLPASCVGVDCPDGEDCAQGRCYPKDCETKVCSGFGEVCVEDSCQERTCVGVRCQDGQVCAGGQCYPADCAEAGCPGPDDICVDGLCVERNCAHVECDQGLCVDGRCLPADCILEDCAEGLEVCIEDECVPLACVQVTCEPGTRCAAGTCYPTECAGVTCAADEVCLDGTCLDRLCVGVDCETPPPAECRGSQLVSFLAPGICQEGRCRFEESAVDCPEGCSDGVCSGADCGGVPCDDGNPCTQDRCDPAQGCVFEPVADGTDCGTCAACQGGECIFDPDQHEDCGPCEKCTARFTCGFQTSTEDLKDECDGGTCKRQNCNGRGSCLRNDGYDCGTCAECQDGECVYDSSQHEDCGLCQRCTARFTCGNQTTSQDLKDECDAGDCTTGNCSGTGAACGRRANGTVCGELYCERTELRQPVCQAGACTGSSLVEDCGYSSGCERGRCIGGACEVLCVDTAGACGSGERCGYNEWGECTCIPMLK